MKKKLFYSAMLVILLALGMIFTACGDMASLTIQNDGTRAYYVQVIINGETRRELSELLKGGKASFSDSSDISYVIRYSKTSFWNPILGSYQAGTIVRGDSHTIKISEFENSIY